MAAMPFPSEGTDIWNEDRMTGMGLLPMPESPIQTTGKSCGARATRDWKTTLAPSTGCGGEAESVTCTLTGRKFCVVETICKSPPTGCSMSEDVGTTVAEKLRHGLSTG